MRPWEGQQGKLCAACKQPIRWPIVFVVNNDRCRSKDAPGYSRPVQRDAYHPRCAPK